MQKCYQKHTKKKCSLSSCLWIATPYGKDTESFSLHQTFASAINTSKETSHWRWIALELKICDMYHKTNNKKKLTSGSARDY